MGAKATKAVIICHEKAGNNSCFNDTPRKSLAELDFQSFSETSLRRVITQSIVIKAVRKFEPSIISLQSYCTNYFCKHFDNTATSDKSLECTVRFKIRFQTPSAKYSWTLQFWYNRQQPSPLLYSIDIRPARNSRLRQRETNHYIARCASVLL